MSAAVATVEVQPGVQYRILSREALLAMGIIEEEVVTDASQSQGNGSVSHPTPTKGVEWTDDETKFLFDKLEEYLPQVGLSNTFPRKKHMWDHIAQDMYEKCQTVRTGVQCENRYKTVMKRKSRPAARSRSAASSKVRKPTDFEEQLRRIESITNSLDQDTFFVEFDPDAGPSNSGSNPPSPSDHSERNPSPELPSETVQAEVPDKSAETIDLGAFAKGSREWTVAETQFLFKRFTQYVSKVGPMRRFKKKNMMWEQISRDIAHVFKTQRSRVQCETRYKTILRRKKFKIAGLPKPTRRPIRSAEDEARRRRVVNQLLGVTSSAEICEVVNQAPPDADKHQEDEDIGVAVETGSGVAVENGNGVEDIELQGRKMSRFETVLYRIHREREAARDRRHREKMEVLKAVLKKIH